MSGYCLIAASIPLGERVKVSSISAKIGTAPAKTIASTEATKVKGGTITLSPAPMPAEAKAVDNAVVPLETR